MVSAAGRRHCRAAPARAAAPAGRSRGCPGRGWSSPQPPTQPGPASHPTATGISLDCMTGRPGWRQQLAVSKGAQGVTRQALQHTAGTPPVTALCYGGPKPRDPRTSSGAWHATTPPVQRCQGSLGRGQSGTEDSSYGLASPGDSARTVRTSGRRPGRQALTGTRRPPSAQHPSPLRAAHSRVFRVEV